MPTQRHDSDGAATQPHKLTSINFLWFHFNTAVTPLPVHRQPTTASFRCHHCLSIAPSHPRHAATTAISACQQALFTPSLQPFDLATTALLPRHYGPLTSSLLSLRGAKTRHFSFQQANPLTDSELVQSPKRVVFRPDCRFVFSTPQNGDCALTFTPPCLVNIS